MAKTDSLKRTTPRDRRSTLRFDGLHAPKAKPLNFKVGEEFRREFKTYAAQHDKKLNQVLYEAFAALKAKRAE